MANKNTEIFDKQNAEVMAELIVDPSTTDILKVNIIQKILESREGINFFQTMFEEILSFGACPCCGHENHWAIPEDQLNQMGWVTSQIDKKVSENTDEENCPQWQQACAKKRITT
jgi:hypothetical protein